ncbi:MAG: lysoplasmalogenase [Clostridiales bacterium]|nr:lysoplasmalogenase [Clostridiales bacterium]
MFLLIFLWIIEVVFASLFIRFGWPGPTRKGFACKIVASATFVIYTFVLAFMGKTMHDTYALFIILGIICGFIGDVVMALEAFIDRNNQKLLTATVICGGIVFFGGHILYVIGFLKSISAVNDTLHWYTPVWLITLLVLIFSGQRMLHFKMGKFAKLCIPYALALGTMSACAATMAFTVYKGNIIPQLCLIIGSLCFVTTDSVLCLKLLWAKRFTTWPQRVIYLSTYYMAQMLIASSVYFAVK